MPDTETFARAESDRRLAAFRNHLPRIAPQARGAMIFSRLNIFYFTGTWANGLLWIPLDGRPILFCRKAAERARLESPLSAIVEFVSYSEIPGLAKESGSPLAGPVAAEMTGLSWSLATLLQNRMPDIVFLPGDRAIGLARAVKTDFEIAIMREAGRRHHQAKYEELPRHIAPGMTEYDIAVALWQVFFELGHQGMMRMQAPGEEVFLGHVSAGISGIHPSVFNGPVGLRGVHPAVPFMGSRDKIWKPGRPLTVDCGFGLEGYHTDKTQVYWAAGSRIPDQARRAQEFCQRIQAELASELKPGAIPEELFSRYWELSRKEGWEEGFMGLGGNKVRFLGHGIGLTVDEHPVVARRFAAPLEANMVLALEPKLGIPGLGMVGVENTFLVTDVGGECLTGDVFDPVMVG
ncbi:MAG: aminopeptidase P family protein [Deltaproteobacteria bacterium]|nr:aminopeptidase P family protein [Deltaproteobacteria bacterium]